MGRLNFEIILPGTEEQCLVSNPILSFEDNFSLKVRNLSRIVSSVDKYVTGNSASFFGGGALIIESVLKATPKSYLRFVRNYAILGGGMFSIASTLNFQGYLTFLENNASLWGGGLFLDTSMCKCEGRISFSGWWVDGHFFYHAEGDD
jgi:hypothetical protein